MIRKPKPRNSWFTILILVAAVAIWGYNQLNPPPEPDRRNPSATREKSTPPAPGNSAGVEKIGGYEVYRRCTLAEARNNDGDSFMVNLPNGEKAEFRLYFVDTPESAFKSYPGGQNNHERIRQQAAAMGGITPDQAVEIGKKGKAFTLGLLAKQPFTIYTQWDSPFHDERFHAFVEVMQDGKKRWLEELLVERGLVRIHTKPADLPDGTSASRHKERLKELERAARR
jgi:endonuclease YncB( thermonuclease family)